MRPWAQPAFTDYRRFHALALQTGDVDPVYPVLTALAHARGMSADEAAWLGLLHVAYYDLGSAVRAYARTGGTPTEPDDDLLSLPCATERRGHRDPRQLARHLHGVVERCRAHGGPVAWLHHSAAGAGRPSYNRAFTHLQEAPGNGRWAAYKTCELLSHLLRGYDPMWAVLEPTDMGHAHSTGPRHGLALLTPVPAGNGAAAVAELDRISADLCAELAAAGLPAAQATAETTLCDFHALTAGRYYVGHDIDQMAQQLHRATQRAQPDSAEHRWLTHVWQARTVALPAAYLGELADPPWAAPDPVRRILYRRDRAIVERAGQQVPA